MISITQKIDTNPCLDDFYWNDFNKFIFVFDCSQEARAKIRFGGGSDDDVPENGIYEMDIKTFNLLKISDLDKSQIFSLIKKNIYNPSWSRYPWYQNYDNGAFSGDGKFFAYPEESNFSVNTNYGSRDIPQSEINILKINL